MRKVTKRDVEDAWRVWAAIDIALPLPDGGWAANGLTPATAARMLAHLRFSAAFCDYILQNEPGRIVEVTKTAVMQAVAKRQREVEVWLEDWKSLPESMAKEHSREWLAESHRFQMELICLRQLWLASQATIGEYCTLGADLNNRLRARPRKRGDRPRSNHPSDHGSG